MNPSSKATFWVDGIAASQIAVQDRAFAYGDGLFATMRVDDSGQVQFLDSHINKLVQGAKRLGFDWQLSQASQVRLTQVAQNNPNHCIKLQVSRGQGGRGYASPDSPTPIEVLSVNPIPAHYQAWQQQGIALHHCDIALGRQPRLAGIKHCNRLEQVLIKSEPLMTDFDDVWVADEQGFVIEASMANLFVLIDGHWHTPSLSHSGVAGMMRRQVLQSLLELGHNIHVAPVSIKHFKEAQAVLMTNSLLGVVTVNRVDNQQFSGQALQACLILAQQLRDKLQLAL